MLVLEMDSIADITPLVVAASILDERILKALLTLKVSCPSEIFWTPLALYNGVQVCIVQGKILLVK